MKLSGLKCLFSLRPQSTVNVPVVAPFSGLGLLTFGLTFVMSTKKPLSAPSARADSPPLVVATASAPTAVRPSRPAATFNTRGCPL